VEREKCTDEDEEWERGKCTDEGRGKEEKVDSVGLRECFQIY
jgi:hypothetical protein